MVDPLRVFFLYPSTILRREIFKPGTMRYGNTSALYGADHAAEYNVQVSDNLNSGPALESSFFGRYFDPFLNKILKFLGGAGGDWSKVFQLRQRFNACDVIFSATDRVGIPLMIFMALGWVPRKPVIYVSIGLPERLEKASAWFHRFFRFSLQRYAHKLLSYGFQECEALKFFIGSDKAIFVPFGIDTAVFHPSSDSRTTIEGDYVLSIGADTFRDFDLLLHVASSYTGLIRIITLRNHWKPSVTLPSNTEISFDIPFLKLPEIIEHARYVVLPVKSNSYSGATTTLLQCMAMGKAVIVSKTPAIETGYDLVSDHNVIFVPPGNLEALSAAMARLDSSESDRSRIGAQARATVQERFSYARYCRDIFAIMHEVAQTTRKDGIFE